MNPLSAFLAGTCVLVVQGAIIFDSVVKPLEKVVRSQRQMLADCESKMARDQFCEIVAIPKVKK